MDPAPQAAVEEQPASAPEPPPPTTPRPRQRKRAATTTAKADAAAVAPPATPAAVESPAKLARTTTDDAAAEVVQAHHSAPLVAGSDESAPTDTIDVDDASWLWRTMNSGRGGSAAQEPLTAGGRASSGAAHLNDACAPLWVRLGAYDASERRVVPLTRELVRVRDDGTPDLGADWLDALPSDVRARVSSPDTPVIVHVYGTTRRTSVDADHRQRRETRGTALTTLGELTAGSPGNVAKLPVFYQAYTVDRDVGVASAVLASLERDRRAVAAPPPDAATTALPSSAGTATAASAAAALDARGSAAADVRDYLARQSGTTVSLALTPPKPPIRSSNGGAPSSTAMPAAVAAADAQPKRSSRAYLDGALQRMRAVDTLSGGSAARRDPATTAAASPPSRHHSPDSKLRGLLTECVRLNEGADQVAAQREAAMARLDARNKKLFDSEFSPSLFYFRHSNQDVAGHTYTSSLVSAARGSAAWVESVQETSSEAEALFSQACVLVGVEPERALEQLENALRPIFEPDTHASASTTHSGATSGAAAAGRAQPLASAKSGPKPQPQQRPPLISDKVELRRALAAVAMVPSLAVRGSVGYVADADPNDPTDRGDKGHEHVSGDALATGQGDCEDEAVSILQTIQRFTSAGRQSGASRTLLAISRANRCFVPMLTMCIVSDNRIRVDSQSNGGARGTAVVDDQSDVPYAGLGLPMAPKKLGDVRDKVQGHSTVVLYPRSKFVWTDAHGDDAVAGRTVLSKQGSTPSRARLAPVFAAAAGRGAARDGGDLDSAAAAAHAGVVYGPESNWIELDGVRAGTYIPATAIDENVLPQPLLVCESTGLLYPMLGVDADPMMQRGASAALTGRINTAALGEEFHSSARRGVSTDDTQASVPMLAYGRPSDFYKYATLTLTTDPQVYGRDGREAFVPMHTKAPIAPFESMVRAAALPASLYSTPEGLEAYMSSGEYDPVVFASIDRYSPEQREQADRMAMLCHAPPPPVRTVSGGSSSGLTSSRSIWNRLFERRTWTRFYSTLRHAARNATDALEHYRKRLEAHKRLLPSGTRDDSSMRRAAQLPPDATHVALLFREKQATRDATLDSPDAWQEYASKRCNTITELVRAQLPNSDVHVAACQLYNNTCVYAVSAVQY